MPESNPLSFPLTIHPVTPDRWPDMQKLFGPRGACDGCWCMFWRQTRSEYEKYKRRSETRPVMRFIVGEVQ